MYDYTALPHRSMLMVDSRSFYASAHCSLLGLDPFTTYLAVVGDPDRSGSIVLAASIALKRDFGVSNVSRYFELPKDPRIIVVKAQMGKYIETSLEITKILNQFAPFDSILQYSIDEAWCDITGTEKLFGDKWTVARMIKDKIWKEVRIPVTIGIGPNMLVSKLCLDMAAKKTLEGIAEWTYDGLPSQMFHLPIKEMWGIGSRMERNLNRMGIRTIGHLANFDKAILEKKWGVMGTQLHQHCWGIDTSQVQPNYDVTHKSYGNSITLLRDYNNQAEIKIVIRELCDEVTRRARKDKMVG
jgi:DNA polymerase V